MQQIRIHVDDLTLNEFRSVISRRIEDKFIENMKFNELFKFLPKFYDYEDNWNYNFSINQMKSLLWMVCVNKIYKIKSF